MSKNVCANCKYCHAETVTDEFDGTTNKSHHCRRYAPRMICGVGVNYADWEWPQVKADDWCGEYQPEDK